MQLFSDKDKKKKKKKLKRQNLNGQSQNFSNNLGLFPLGHTLGLKFQIHQANTKECDLKIGPKRE